MTPTHSYPAVTSLQQADNGTDTEEIELTSTHPGSHLPLDANTELPAITSRLKQVIVIAQLCSATLTASIVNGLVIVALPAISADLHLPASLAFWPASVSGLATASSLLLSGSIADAVGPWPVEIVGCLISGAFMIASGFAATGQQFVAMRAIQGVGLSLHLVSSIAIITRVLPSGEKRNLAFSLFGLSQPLGFSIGLILGGVFVDTIGWRAGWFLSGGCTLFATLLGAWAIPRSQAMYRTVGVVERIKSRVDVIGALLASAFMAMLCYLLAILSADIRHIHDLSSILLLCFIVVTLPSFVIWSHYQVSRQRPALIPNSMWMNPTFSCICIVVSLSFAVLNALELFASLFFQEIQHLSAIQASIRILPSLIVGVSLSLTMGFFVHKVSAVWIIVLTSIACAGSPLLMAMARPSGSYWVNPFFAQLLQPVSCNTMFTLGLIVVTDVFHEDTQGLAGAVFNTAAQFGTALGLAILQVLSTLVTEAHKALSEEEARLAGYKASFWTMVGFMVLCAGVGVFGFRNAGKVGLKRD